MDQLLEFLRGSVGGELEGTDDCTQLFLGSLDAGGGGIGKLGHCVGEVLDCAGIALVDDFNVVGELGEVSGEGAEGALSLRWGGHCTAVTCGLAGADVALQTGLRRRLFVGSLLSTVTLSSSRAEGRKARDRCLYSATNR